MTDYDVLKDLEACVEACRAKLEASSATVDRLADKEEERIAPLSEHFKEHFKFPFGTIAMDMGGCMGELENLLQSVGEVLAVASIGKSAA